MDLRFRWNTEKAAQNLAKHGVTFEEAATVFDDLLARILDDPDHSTEEDCEILIGYSSSARLLLVSYTERAGTIRIISARQATRLERKHHEEKILSRARR